MFTFRNLTTLLFCILMNATYGQNKTIIGKVTNESGEPVASAAISFKNSREYGTMTDKDGTYKTSIPKNADSIICRHLNFIYKTIKIDGNNIINFILTKEKVYTTELTIIGTHKYTQEEIYNSQKEDKFIEDDKVFTRVEISAQFPGGNDAVKKYLAKTIIYPNSATISDVKGIVKIGFVIGIDGYTKSFKLLKGVNKFADDAVINALKKMPKWIPAMQNGSYVEQPKEVSVTFNIIGRID